MTNDLTQPSRQAIAARDRSKPLQVSGKLKTVLDRVVHEGADPYEAGRAVGMHAQSIRKALAKPHVLQYLRHARQVFRETARAQNIHHAVTMRAGSPNEMAKLGAMRLLENVDDDRALGRGFGASPGFCIILRSPPRDAPLPSSPALTIEHEPAPPTEPEPEPVPPAIARAAPRRR